jgi:hypothetical protein
LINQGREFADKFAVGGEAKAQTTPQQQSREEEPIIMLPSDINKKINFTK